MFDKTETYSKSIPSNLYFWTKFDNVLTNAVRFFAEPTAVERKREPVQPPTEIEADTL